MQGKWIYLEFHFSDPTQKHLQAGFPLESSEQFFYERRRWNRVGIFKKTCPHVVERTIKSESPTTLELALKNEFYSASRVFLAREESDGLKFKVYKRAGAGQEDLPPVIVITPRDEFLNGHELFQEHEQEADSVLSVEDLVEKYALCVTDSAAFEKDLGERERAVSDFAVTLAQQALPQSSEAPQTPKDGAKTHWQLYGELKAKAAEYKAKAKAEVKLGAQNRKRRFTN